MRLRAGWVGVQRRARASWVCARLTCIVCAVPVRRRVYRRAGFINLGERVSSTSAGGFRQPRRAGGVAQAYIQRLCPGVSAPRRQRTPAPAASAHPGASGATPDASACANRCRASANPGPLRTRAHPGALGAPVRLLTRASALCAIITLSRMNEFSRSTCTPNITAGEPEHSTPRKLAFAFPFHVDNPDANTCNIVRCAHFWPT